LVVFFSTTVGATTAFGPPLSNTSSEISPPDPTEVTLSQPETRKVLPTSLLRVTS
jgi:hypothetical protein